METLSLYLRRKRESISQECIEYVNIGLPQLTAVGQSNQRNPQINHHCQPDT